MDIYYYLSPPDACEPLPATALTGVCEWVLYNQPANVNNEVGRHLIWSLREIDDALVLAQLVFFVPLIQSFNRDSGEIVLDDIILKESSII